MKYNGGTNVTLKNTGHGLEVTGNFNSIIALPYGTYHLEKMVFHSPSEHTLDGACGSGEFQLVHVGTDKSIAIISILLQEGSEKSEIDFWSHLGIGKNLPSKPGNTAQVSPINWASLSKTIKGDFYHYTGSLTAPPCSDKVRWYVMKTTVSVSPEQISSFKALYPDPANNRPIQPANGRQIVCNAVGIEGEFPKGVETTLTKAANVGDTELIVATSDGFMEGDQIIIGGQETKSIARFGSIIVSKPMEQAFPEGAVVQLVSRKPHSLATNATNATGITFITAPLAEGQKEMQVDDASVFNVGEKVNIGKDTFKIVSIVGNRLSADQPVKSAYPAGTEISSEDYLASGNATDLMLAFDANASNNSTSG
jgi:carbonic anhydrase